MGTIALSLAACGSKEKVEKTDVDVTIDQIKLGEDNVEYEGITDYGNDVTTRLSTSD